MSGMRNYPRESRVASRKQLAPGGTDAAGDTGRAPRIHAGWPTAELTGAAKNWRATTGPRPKDTCHGHAPAGVGGVLLAAGVAG